MSPESAGGLGSWLVSGQSRQDARAASIDAVLTTFAVRKTQFRSNQALFRVPLN